MDNQLVFEKNWSFIYINFVESELNASMENEGGNELPVHIFLDRTEPSLKAEFELLEDILLKILDIKILILENLPILLTP